jgi:hypothetical protein
VESSTIALFIKYFNIASIAFLALFAVFGAVAFFNKKARVNAFLLAFCAAVIAAFALESTVFNLPSYLKYFAGPPVAIVGQSEEDPANLLTSDGTPATMRENNKIVFSGLNRHVTSIFVDINYDTVETARMRVQWTDDGSAYRYEKTLYQYLPQDNYAVLQTYGTVSEITVDFPEPDRLIEITEVVINKPVPFYFSGLRLLAVSLLLFALYVPLNKNLRAKAAYYLFEYKFDPENRKQNAVYACAVALLILFSWVCVYTSRFFDNNPEGDTIEPGMAYYMHYNKFLVDALIAGRTYLDYGKPEGLLAAERPYDRYWLSANGYKENDDWIQDWSWYKGKYYCYYGIVPAALLYAPYKLITGHYLSYPAGIFLFCMIAVILLALLWRHCVKKYMRDSEYALYLLSFIALFFTIGLCYALRYPHFYSLVQSAGFMFVAAGAFLLFKSVDGERTNRYMLFFGCLCLALVFGCRPNMGFASLIVPVVLWKRRSWKLLFFVMIPYIIVAIPLCVYNYVRFESIFDFGQSYCLSTYDSNGFKLQNPVGKLIRVFESFMYYLFRPVSLSLFFPFVNVDPIYASSRPDIYIILGAVHYFERGCALINFPIVFCLAYMFKRVFDGSKPAVFRALRAFLIIGIVLMAVDSFVIGFQGRYMLDMAAFFMFPSLFCVYYCCRADAALPVGCKIRLSAAYGLIAVSVFVGLFLFVRCTEFVPCNAALYRYLEYSLGVIRHV